MEFKQLQSFAAVAECRSFTRAAERLFVSQPTVSLHIRDLEQELRTKLVVRSTHAVDLTDSGRLLYEYALQILSLREAALRRLRKDDGEVCVGTSTVPATSLLPDILTGFREECPQVRTVLVQTDSGAVLEGLTRGTMDVGFTGARSDDRDLLFTPLARDRLVLVTAAAEPFLGWKSRGLLPREELARTPFLTREAGSGSQGAAERLLEQLGLGPGRRRSAGQVSDPEALKNLVAAGIGVAVMSDRSVARETEEGRLLTFELPAEGAERELYLVQRSDGVLKTGAARFIDYVKAHASP